MKSDESVLRSVERLEHLWWRSQIVEKTLDGQIALYGKQAETRATERERAMDCFGLEAILGLGLHIYHSIRNADERWSDAVRSQVSPLRRQDAEQLERWYSAWIKPCDGLLANVSEFEREGYQVRHAEEFREACRQVRSILCIPLERVLADRDESAGKPMREVRDALRRRLEPGRAG